MDSPRLDHVRRYDRQIAYQNFGPAGQKRLAAAAVLIVGVGGLGSALAEQLGRAGVGRLRLVDDDRVALDNLHRQHLYTEADAAAGRSKAVVAAEHLGRINSRVAVEPVVERVDRRNIDRLTEGVDLVLDGTDNWPTRFLINDVCVKRGLPWVYAGVIAAEATTMTVVPGDTPCLRCVYESPPPACSSPTCEAIGVLGPAVSMITGFQATEAVKLLIGRTDAISRALVSFDLWANRVGSFDVARNAAIADCPCCKHGIYEYLEA